MIKGKAHKFGANIDTDAIIPARYANLTVPEELGNHCMEGIAPDFSQKVLTGDIIIADTNFGCGSSREVAPISIKGAGVAGVIAKNICANFFPQRHQHRIAVAAMPRGSGQYRTG